MIKVGLAVLLFLIILILIRINSIVVYRFHKPWCKFCIQSQAEWDKFSSACLFKLVRPIDINLDEAENQKLANQYGISGVPQIVKVSTNGQFEIYSGDRTADAYTAWVSR